MSSSPWIDPGTCRRVPRYSALLDSLRSTMDAVREPEPERSDEEIAELVRELKADRPDLDWDNLLMGRLAGPASDDRPAVPVWDYPAVAASDPEIQLEDLAAVRFPVRYFEGGWSVTSVDEHLKPFPSSYEGTLLTPRFPRDAMSVIRMYQALHDADLVAWDADSRGLIYLQPIENHRATINSWADDETRRAGPAAAE